MSKRTQAADDDRIWKALADATRRELLDCLRQGPRTTGDLCDAFPGLSRTGVLKHLDVLVGAGLVVIRREGRFRWNYLNSVPIQQIQERWISPHMNRLASAAARLEALATRKRPAAGKSPGKPTKPEH